MPFQRQLPFSVDAAAELLREPSTLGIPLLTIAMTAYGDEIFGNPETGIEPMDPIELYTRLEEDFRAELPDTAEARLQAIITAVATDGFYEDPLIFTSIALALTNGNIGTLPDGILEEITLPEAVWAVYEVALVRDDDIKLGPLILQAIDEIIGEAADDFEDGGEEPSHEHFVRNMKMDLIGQMTKLGIKIPELGVTALTN